MPNVLWAVRRVRHCDPLEDLAQGSLHLRQRDAAIVEHGHILGLQVVATEKSAVKVLIWENEGIPWLDDLHQEHLRAQVHGGNELHKNPRPRKHALCQQENQIVAPVNTLSQTLEVPQILRIKEDGDREKPARRRHILLHQRLQLRADEGSLSSRLDLVVGQENQVAIMYLMAHGHARRLAQALLEIGDTDRRERFDFRLRERRVVAHKFDVGGQLPPWNLLKTLDGADPQVA
mmetsp:Transcript_4018/g.12960  ORF Transcript_4018/g.12960 Transcript_4018/m.12960 type:complete len:233 (-) Transcript_4018:220-918(-)|eukprot:CAMPEP_0175769874 /NCGR_PEP_ID=MMETSP0097-20121207/71189_1 /TAXON_ID=311494 /ORGANISM="Alexandrium monilatum, Strain CCMP3105" /LENGTH=232 /DNA_ID=CAMNT_0017080071 /DNA_START=105 /DNA_END=803 /DNA_ORIENTATION=-